MTLAASAAISNTRAVGKDIKLFVMVPGNLSAVALRKLSEGFFKLRLPWSSAQIDIQGALGLAKGLSGQLVQGDMAEFGKKKPNDYIAGLQTAYFKSLGNATALANTGFIGLPGWFPITQENANEWSQILEEHSRVLILLNEDHTEGVNLLFLYRDFLSAADTEALLEFLASYAPYLLKARERGNTARQFTTHNLRRLLMSLDDSFKDIVEDSGFRAVAGAIRRATVTEQYHKSQGNQVFDIEYGLFQELKRKARFPEQFISALSEFVSRYNYENARREEQLGGKSGRRRARLTTEDLDRVVKLMDGKDSESVAMLLIAYGSAREPRAPDEAREMTPDEGTESE